MWPDGRIAYLNDYWERFARDNGAAPEFRVRWGLGSSLFEACSPRIRAFYQQAYRGCLASGRPWEHEYECSSASTFRVFRQTAYPLSDGRGLLIMNSIVVERPHDPAERSAALPSDEDYRDVDGFVHQCCHCRRVMLHPPSSRWDWVPEWVERMPRKASHTLCPPCFGHHFPGADRSDGRG